MKWLKKLLRPKREINATTSIVEGRLNNSPIYAKLLEATKCIETGAALYTIECLFPRSILSEQNTHRLFSRNTGSGRAIPVLKMLKMVLAMPFIPLFWGANKAGMQSAIELDWYKRLLCSILWTLHRYFSVFTVYLLTKLGLHKQWANRLIEPHLYVRQVVTASSFKNYFDLRIHDDAQPEIIYLAYLIKEAILTAKYRKVSYKNQADAYNWHLPYILESEREKYRAYPLFLAKLSASRCARTSYLTQEGVEPKPEKEIETFKKLAGSDPIHASPLEHQACPLVDARNKSRNLTGFKQYREIFEETVERNAPIVIPKV